MPDTTKSSNPIIAVLWIFFGVFAGILIAALGYYVLTGQIIGGSLS